ncbi:hypothetical protein Tco_0352551 [Tanacetum coccineum]
MQESVGRCSSTEVIQNSSIDSTANQHSLTTIAYEEENHQGNVSQQEVVQNYPKVEKSDIQRQLYKDLVEAYAADKILLDTYGDTVTIKRPRDGQIDDEDPPLEQTGGPKEGVQEKNHASTSAPSETTTRQARQTTDTGRSLRKTSDQEL